MSYKRFHPYRSTQDTRDFHAEASLTPSDFIAPLFVVEGKEIRREIPKLQDVYHLSIDRLLKEVEKLSKLEVKKILLFGVVENSLKTERGDYAWAEDGLVQQAVKSIKHHFPALTIYTDVCLCGYTTHGHCGILNKQEIDNDNSIELLGKIAVSHARAGADYVSPSAMMDGQVYAIRKALDKAGFAKTRIMAYSAKYASTFYGPFREAAKSSPAFGDRKAYQMDFRTSTQAIGESEADLEEGADVLMVKPAHTYLDIISRIKTQQPDSTLAAYHVSGEYMLLKAAANAGLIDEDQSMLEVLTAIKRAGSDLIISYYAERFANYFRNKTLQHKENQIHQHLN